MKDAIASCTKEILDLTRFVEICLDALSAAAKAQSSVRLRARAKRALGDGDGVPEQYDLERAAELEAFARQEAALGFASLFGLCVIKLWSIAETAIEGVVAHRLADPARRGDHAILRHLKGPLVDFARLGSEDQAARLAQLLAVQVDAKLKPGVGRFEAVLGPVGLGGGIEDQVRVLILELQQVRHVYVHNGGLADDRFIKACPWLHLASGQRVLLTLRHFFNYALAVKWYIIELRRRTLNCDDTKRIEATEVSKKELLDLITEGLRCQTEEPPTSDRDNRPSERLEKL